MKPKKIGKFQKVSMATGEVVEEKQNAMTLLPPTGDVCQECAVDHPHDQPHNKQSLYYQYHFYSTHGRWPTWTDAMAHCPPNVRAIWRARLREKMIEVGMEVPLDLIGDEPSMPVR